MNSIKQENTKQNSVQKLSNRNLLMFSLGTFGRDFVYCLFAANLINFILYTKQLTEVQFGAVTAIIIGARLFDAFNDPIMGGIVENTRTKWGKFKPWQLIGSITTGIVIIALFTNDYQGSSFVWFLGIIYFLFSITFTMNDISYWGMLPSLSSNEHDRSKLTAVAQIVAGAGGALAGVAIPAFTIGNFAIGGNAITGYKVISIVAVLLMIAFQMFTILGVKEKPLEPILEKKDKLTLKQMFTTLAKNDQLMWITIITLLFCIGTGVIDGGLNTTYIYFEFGYEGLLTTFFGILFGVFSGAFTATYPWIEKKFSRTKLIYATGIALIVGYMLMLIFGLILPSGAPNTAAWYTKFIVMASINGIVGFGRGFYMIMIISIANTVEYNEYKFGKREEGLIFSLRPFTAKLSSAISQGLVTVVYIVAGVLTYTNKISALENEAAQNIISEEVKTGKIKDIISTVSADAKKMLLVCMCLICMSIMAVALLIYKKKFTLDEATYSNILRELEARREQEEDS